MLSVATVLILVHVFAVESFPGQQAFEAVAVAELTEALRVVVERHTASTCETLSFKLQWSSVSGGHLLLDMVGDIAPTIGVHATTLYTPTSTSFADGQASHYVWLFDTLESFETLDLQLRERSASDPNFGKGDYLLVYVMPSATLPVADQLFRVLRTFHEFNIFSVNVMMNVPQASGVHFYTHRPSQPPVCNAIQLHLSNIFRKSSLRHPELLAPRITNFNGCPLRVLAQRVAPFICIEGDSVDTLTGFEGEIIKTIADKLNATLQFLPQPNEPSSVRQGGEVSGLFRMIRDNEGDFIVGLQFLSALKLQYFKPSVSYYTTRQVLVLRKGAHADFDADWLLMPFTNRTWLYVGLCCACLLPFGLAIQYTFARKSVESDRKQRRYVILNVFAMILGISQSLIPKRSLHRMAFAATSLSLLVLRSIYQGKIYDDYNVARKDGTPDTLDELVRRNYTILTTYAFDVPEILTEQSEDAGGSGVLQVIRNEVMPEENFELLLHPKTPRKAALTTSLDFYNYYVNKHNMHGVFKVLPQHLVPLKGCLYFRRQSYMQQEIDSIISRLEPGGILSKWSSQNNNMRFEAAEREPHAINMDKLELVTLWYVYFCLLAALVFVCEILCARYWRCKEAKDKKAPPNKGSNDTSTDIGGREDNSIQLV